MPVFKDRWNALTRGGSRAGQNGGDAIQRPGNQAARGKESAFARRSNGLEQFFAHIHGEEGLRLLDLAGASQANVGFITSLGHSMATEDIIKGLDLAFGRDEDYYGAQADPVRIEKFLKENLDYRTMNFDGVLVWDTLEYMAPELLRAVVERLYDITKPQSYLLAFLHAEERSDLVTAYSYRIADSSTLHLSPRGVRRPARYFNNRAVENLFNAYESVKFFLSRDSLREVIVKR